MLEENAPKPDLSKIIGQVPLLGVCYGAQYLAVSNGGDVQSSDSREYGRANLSVVDTSDELLVGMSMGSQVWMSHGDTILGLGDGFETICSTGDVEFAGFRAVGKLRFGVYNFTLKYSTAQRPCPHQKLRHGYLRMFRRMDARQLRRSNYR